MTEELERYAQAVGASEEVLGWLRTTGKKALTRKFFKLDEAVSEMEHILDFLVSSAAPKRLQKMSIADAKRKAHSWSEANKKKGRHLVDSPDDVETIHKFDDGTAIVRLKTKSALQREGFLMNHCAGGYNPDSADCLIYSYRDADNMPHATFEVRKNNNEIVQIKGKGNGPIHPKYIHPILAFLRSVGMDVRPNDMVNLGYHHLHKDHLEFLKKFPKAWKQVTEINGEVYAF